jgi:hypothetical protein
MLIVTGLLGIAGVLRERRQRDRGKRKRCCGSRGKGAPLAGVYQIGHVHLGIPPLGWRPPRWTRRLGSGQKEFTACFQRSRSGRRGDRSRRNRSLWSGRLRGHLDAALELACDPRDVPMHRRAGAVGVSRGNPFGNGGMIANRLQRKIAGMKVLLQPTP